VTESPYSGCLGDISINGKRLDFTDAYVTGSSISQKCLTVEEKEALAVEGLELNGRTIPKYDETDDEETLVRTTASTTTTSTTTTTTTTTTQAPLPVEPDADNNLWDTDEYDKEKDDDDDDDDGLSTKKDEEVAPTPFMKCALPVHEVPSDTKDVDMDEGIRFGNLDKLSRLEYAQPKEDGSRSEYAIQFKTSSPNGIIFMWTEFDKMDYVALFMRKGFLHFAFDSGSGPAVLNSTVMYNDSQWHAASFSRYRTQGTLMVDDNIVATGNSSGSTTNVNAGSTIYVGGIPSEGWQRRMTFKKLLNIESPFRGCLRQFRIKNKPAPAPTYVNSVQPCATAVENGFYFYPNAGYLKLCMSTKLCIALFIRNCMKCLIVTSFYFTADKFKVGRNIKLSLSIKPRKPSGILVSVHGEKDFMVLQMINGTIKFTVDNGKGPLYSSFSKDTYDLCDGNWHSIQGTLLPLLSEMRVFMQNNAVYFGRLS